MDKKKIPQFKKDIKDFLLREEGQVVKKDVVKLGMTLLVLGIGLKTGMKADEADAQVCTRCAPAPGCPY